MTRAEITTMINTASASITDANEILVPNGGLTALELKELLNGFNSSVISIVHELNNSTLNSVDDSSQNMANTPLGLESNLVHNGLGFSWRIDNASHIGFLTNVAPPVGKPSFEFNGFGTFGGSEKIAAFTGWNGYDILSLFNQGVQVHTPMGVNGAVPSGFYAINANGATNVTGRGYFGQGLQLGDGYRTINCPFDVRTLEFRALAGHKFQSWDGAINHMQIDIDGRTLINKNLMVGATGISYAAITGHALNYGDYGGFFTSTSSFAVRGVSTSAAGVRGEANGGFDGGVNGYGQGDYNHGLIGEGWNGVHGIARPGGGGYGGSFLQNGQRGAIRSDGSVTVTYLDSTSITEASTFIMYGSKVSDKVVPTFITEIGDVIKLYAQDLPTSPTTAEIATLLSNLGLANLS